MGAIMDRLNPSPSSAMVDDVKHFLETLDADVIVWAVNTAADENKTGWSYVKAILNRCKNSNLTTMTAVREHERQRMKRKEAKQGGTDLESDEEANARWGIKYSV
jgi:DnaD/phage-associated family protein